MTFRAGASSGASRLALLAVLVQGWACGPAEAPREPRRASPEVGEPAPPLEGHDGADGADEAVEAALAEVAQIRQLAPKGPVRSRVLPRVEMANRVREKIVNEVPPNVVSGQSALLVALGLAPADFDLLDSLIVLMSSELAGYYEPADRTMYLAEDLEGAERHATLAHELVHALQDQHYGLGERITYKQDEGDAQSAVHALAEGDATSAMLDGVLRDRNMTALDVPGELLGIQVRGAIELANPSAPVPGIIRRSLIAPYVDGVELVHALRRKGGWAAVDELWRNPPESTEQVLHPEKLSPRDLPVAVAVPAPPEPSLPLVYTDVFGEQSLRLVFEEWMPRATAVAAASDWGGDRVAVFGSASAGTWVLWHIEWDQTEAARRGFQGFARGALSSAGESDPKAAAAKAVAKGRLCVERAALGAFGVVTRGKSVVVALGPSGAPVTKSGSPACPDALRWAEAVLAGPSGATRQPGKSSPAPG